VLQRDEEAVLDLTEVEDLGDVRVLQLHGDLRLVDEHRDELLVLGDVRQDAFDGEQPLEALDAEGLGLEYLGHASDVDPLEEVVLAERDGFLQCDRTLVVLRGGRTNVDRYGRPGGRSYLSVLTG
jgi:hypothetical protein